MSDLTKLPNIGSTLRNKLLKVGIVNKQSLMDVGSENAIIKLMTVDDSGVCINMLYALEGAIQGVRWHNLSEERKWDLKLFFNSLNLK